MATDNLFEVQIAKFVEKANGNIDLVVRKVALDMFTRVIIKSPVDTGRFKGNWQVAIESIPAGTLKIYDKEGTATIAKVTAEVLGLKAGQIIYLVNNVSYAIPLEYGHSQQAPGGMVRITIQEWNAVVNKAASEVPK
jgi:hypothetical protein